LGRWCVWPVGERVPFFFLPGIPPRGLGPRGWLGRGKKNNPPNRERAFFWHRRGCFILELLHFRFVGGRGGAIPGGGGNPGLGPPGEFRAPGRGT